MPRMVPDWGRTDSKIVLIGEAPGEQEDKQLKPFCGPTGFLLDQWWEEIGLQRADFYITNVVPYRPHNNEIYSIGRDEIREWGLKLHDRLAQLTDPVLLVPTGNISLNALMYNELGDKLKITEWRGSILQYHDLNGRAIKVIPSIHPAATFKQPILSKFCKADWLRIAGDSQFRELRLPERTLTIDASKSQIDNFIHAADRLSDLHDGVPPAMAIDVENSMDGDYFREITCVGFSYNSNRSLTISVRRSDYDSDNAYRFAWESIRTLCQLPIPKVMQNGLTDLFKLKFHGVEVVNYKWDLMEMDHALDPNDGGDTEKGSEEAYKDKSFKMEMRSLRILASLYTREPFYKLEGKLGTHFDWAKFLRYNGKDCCVTREIYGVLWEKLRRLGKV